jgi:hypothetical protein
MNSHALLNPRIQVFAAAILLLFIGWVIRLIRHHQLSLRDSLSWILSTLTALVFVLFPHSLRWVADVLEVEVASNALFALAFVYVLLNLLAATIALSRHASHVRRLTQECALLRAEIDLLRSSIQPPTKAAGS